MVMLHKSRRAEPDDALLTYAPRSRAQDPIFAAPAECPPAVRAKVDTLNQAHRSWASQRLIAMDSRMSGLPAPASIINTVRERKSPNFVANRLRRWLHAPPSPKQAEKRAGQRLKRDAVLAAIRYYGLDARSFDLPTDADILMWSPSRVRALTDTAHQQLYAQILPCELPEAAASGPSARPRVNLRVALVDGAPSPRANFEECYLTFTPPKPFWRREGAPLFHVPIFASCGHTNLWAQSQPSLLKTFAERGPVRFERAEAGVFTAWGTHEGPA